MYKTLSAIIIIVLIILGYWYYSYTQITSVATSTSDEISTTSPSVTGATTDTPTPIAKPLTVKPKGTNTFVSIFSQTGSHECSYEQVSSSGRSSSVIYIADGKMRGEFRTTGANPSSNIMIYNGGYLYTWKEGTTAGIKTTIRSVSDLPQAIPKDLTSGAIIGSGIDSVGWDCHEWIKDAKMLSVPSYLKF